MQKKQKWAYTRLIHILYAMQIKSWHYLYHTSSSYIPWNVKNSSWHDTYFWHTFLVSFIFSHCVRDIIHFYTWFCYSENKIMAESCNVKVRTGLQNSGRVSRLKVRSYVSDKHLTLHVTIHIALQKLTFRLNRFTHLILYRCVCVYSWQERRHAIGIVIGWHINM